MLYCHRFPKVLGLIHFPPSISTPLLSPPTLPYIYSKRVNVFRYVYIWKRLSTILFLGDLNLYNAHCSPPIHNHCFWEWFKLLNVDPIHHFWLLYSSIPSADATFHILILLADGDLDCLQLCHTVMLMDIPVSPPIREIFTEHFQFAMHCSRHKKFICWYEMITEMGGKRHRGPKNGARAGKVVVATVLNSVIHWEHNIWVESWRK